jgi:ribosome-associated protein YbcJ (S4-like RNA binding protein)
MYTEIKVSDNIRLDQFLKWAGIVGTGGMAKAIIQEGEVKVNGNSETRRGKKLHNGDLVQVFNQSTFKVVVEDNDKNL